VIVQYDSSASGEDAMQDAAWLLLGILRLAIACFLFVTAVKAVLRAAQ
jgi:hypothetical protein